MLQHGIILVDKPPGITSHDLVAKARKIFQTKAVGHCGTLDPIASGLMVLLLNEGTKLSQYILEGDKAYQAEFQLGIQTDTLDITGKVLSEQSVTVSFDQVSAAIQKLSGDFEWPVPHFSAIKVDGEKLYDKARRGEEFATPVKRMKFWNIKLIESKASTFRVQIYCSKGSYIRTWIDQLGQLLGCGAVMSGLRRIYSAPYDISKAASLEVLANLRDNEENCGAIIPLHLALPQLKSVRIKGFDEKLLRNGGLSQDLKSLLIQKFDPLQDEYIQVASAESGALICIMGLHPDKGFVIKRGFQYDL